mgnify:FL=1
MIMPEMSGHDCFKALKRINPEINALMSTGYGVNGKSLEFLEEGCSFIQKPYNINDLSASIINALKRDYKSGKEI